MNKERRKAIQEKVDQLRLIIEAADLPGIKDAVSEVRNDVASLHDAEREYYDALPEGLLDSEQSEASEDAISAFELAITGLEEAYEIIDALCEKLAESEGCILDAAAGSVGDGSP